MYCSSCGSECAQGLKYCKQCGANLNSTASLPEGKISFARLAIIFGVIALLGIPGIVGPFAIAEDLMNHHYGDPKLVVMLVMFGSIVSLAVIGIFIWLLFRLVGFSNLVGGANQSKMPRTTAQ